MQIFRVYIFIFGVVLAQGFTCDIKTDCLNSPSAGSLIPDPDDCHKYYICLGTTDLFPSDSSVSCPNGQYFEQSTTSCEQETIPGTCNTEPCGFQSTGIECPVTCVEDFTFVGNTNNCSSYDMCLPGGGRETQWCPDEMPYFNGTMCVSDENQCCDFCLPYCYYPGVEIPDPVDCRSFYICAAVGPVQEELHTTCNPGQYFNIIQATCIAGNDCANLCSSSEVTTTTTTTTTISQTTVACPNTYNCIENGNFPRCNYCDPSYFHCEGGTATIGYCADGYVFNTDPSYAKCVDPVDCPTSGLIL